MERALRCICMGPRAVQLVLAGRKTEERRALAFKTINTGVGSDTSKWKLIWMGQEGECVSVELDRGKEAKVFRCRFGAAGNVLTVMEAWFKDGSDYYFKESEEDNRFAWGAPITMPRDVARATIVLEGVWCQRLSDMTEGSAMAEGVEPKVGADGYPENASHPLIPDGEENRGRQYLAAYFSQWDRTGHGCPSTVNPWAWALRFSLHKP